MFLPLKNNKIMIGSAFIDHLLLYLLIQSCIRYAKTVSIYTRQLKAILVFAGNCYDITMLESVIEE